MDKKDQLIKKPSAKDGFAQLDGDDFDDEDNDFGFEKQQPNKANMNSPLASKNQVDNSRNAFGFDQPNQKMNAWFS